MMIPRLGWAILLAAGPGPDDCGCAKARQTHGWCSACGVGYVAGMRIASAKLYEAVHPHGHDIDPRSVRCEGCRRAIATDGYCDACRMGFVGRQAYFSRLTYCLAKGKTGGGCAACRGDAPQPRWCDRCGAGRLGNVSLQRKEVYLEACRGYGRLRWAMRELARCETCAVAMYCDGVCVKCGKRYRGGEATTQRAGGATSRPGGQARPRRG
jgi:hypothetical protein